MDQSPTYSRSGRMQYHPEYHPNHAKPWTTADEKYLIDYYDKIGPEQVSLDLGRTIGTVMERACRLRSAAVMVKPAKRVYTKRTRSIS